MKSRNKKGFTVVELVIVIAVIAVLASVFIPVFANVIKKARASVELQNARNKAIEVIADEIPDIYEEYEETEEESFEPYLDRMFVDVCEFAIDKRAQQIAELLDQGYRLEYDEEYRLFHIIPLDDSSPATDEETTDAAEETDTAG